MELAVSLGWHTGSRSDDTISPIHRPLFLLDLNYKKVDWPRHLSVARVERPALAVVPDISNPDDLPALLGMAEEIAPHCGSIMFVPKCAVIENLPRCIGGTKTILGYSVPSGYGGTDVGVWDFQGWPVHLLGGTPKRQVKAACHMNVVSADGNMCQKISKRGIAFDTNGSGRQDWEDHAGQWDVPFRSLEQSLINIPIFWQRAGFTLEPNPAGQVRAILTELAPEFGQGVGT